MQIQILSVTQGNQPTKVPGKTTPFLDLAFKNLTFQGKVEGKKLFSFGGNAGGYKVLIGAQPGEVYDIDVVKNDAGYNDWSAAKKSDGSAPSPAPAATNSYAAKSASGLSTSPKSTYETPEERAKKQIYIVRQSNISAAINMLSVGSKAPPKLAEVLEVAKELESYVFGDTAAPAPDKSFADLESTDDFPDVPV